MSKNKKIIIILLSVIIMFTIGIMILTPIAKYFVQYINKPINSLDESDKKEVIETIYDTFEEELFPNLQKELISERYTKDSVDEFIKILKSRFDKNKFKKETWGCVSKYSSAQMYVNTDEIWDNCFNKWFTNFYDENEDIFDLLQKSKN